MIRLLNGILLVCILFLLASCNHQQERAEAHWSAYHLALDHGDLVTAVAEMNALYAMDTSNQAVLDTLVRIYYVLGNHVSTFSTGQKLKEPELLHKRILAESAYQLGKLQDAKRLLMEVERNDTAGLAIGNRYILAGLHFNDEEYAAALSMLSRIVTEEESLEQTTRISGDNQTAQVVSLYAASHNFAGFVFMTMAEYDSAEEHFNEALRAQPNFQLAMNNLAELENRRSASGE